MKAIVIRVTSFASIGITHIEWVSSSAIRLIGALAGANRAAFEEQVGLLLCKESQSASVEHEQAPETQVCP